VCGVFAVSGSAPALGIGGRRLKVDSKLFGLKDVDERVWLVGFMDYDLGNVDLEERLCNP
jgi:hypothetical protein